MLTSCKNPMICEGLLGHIKVEPEVKTGSARKSSPLIQRKTET